MKNLLLFLILFITQMVNAQTVFKPTTLIIGKGSDVDMSYVVDRSGASDPFLKWSATTGKWCFSNDAVTCGEMIDKVYVDDALALKAPLASPALTGIPTAPTALPLTNTTQIATTAYVDSAISSSTAPDATTTTKGIVKLAGDLAGTADLPTVPGLALKAPYASPTFTGDPNAPTATVGDNDTSVATTAFVTTAVTNATDPTKISGPASSTDNAIVRFDGITGKVAQNSNVTVSDTGAVETTSTVKAGSIQMGGLGISTVASANLVLNAGTGTITSSSQARFGNKVFYNISNDTSSGDLITLAVPTTKVITLTGALTSVSGISASDNGHEITFLNLTGGPVEFLNDEALETASNRILTGTDESITIEPNATITFTYDVTTSKWYALAYPGAGKGGIGSTDTAFVQNFDSANLDDFTPEVDLELDDVTPLHGKRSAKLVHASGYNVLFKEVLALDKKFTIKNLTLKLDCTSTATSGNVTLKVRDESNGADLVASEQLNCTTVASADSVYVSFDVPANANILSYTVTGLAQSGSPVTKIDDIEIYITKFDQPKSALVQDTDSTISLIGPAGYGSTSTTTRRFTLVEKNQGTDITYVPSVTLGDSFLINTDGVYTVEYTDEFNAAGNLCITVDATIAQQATGVTSIPNGVRLVCDTTGGVNYSGSATITRPFKAGQVVRAQTNAEGSGANGRALLTITKQGSLRQVSVNKNSKIKIPTSELRFEGYTGLGTGSDTTIVNYTSLVKLSGDAFEINPNGADTAMGEHIKIKKSGILSGTATQGFSGISTVGISINQATRTAFPVASEQLCSASAGASQAASCSFKRTVNAGDVIRVSVGGTPAAFSNNNFNLFFQEQEIQVSVSNVLPQWSETDSSVSVNTANGFGSTGTKIRRFLNIRDNIGSSVQYNPLNDESVNGASFKIMENGIYHISYSDNFSSAQDFGISKNSSNLTTSYNILGLSERISQSANAAAGYSETVSWQGYLAIGDVIRPHTSGVSASVNDRVFFTISKIGKGKVSGIDLTPFVNIPVLETQSMIFNGAATQASNLVFTLPTQTSSDGSGLLTYSSNATTGARFIAQKKVTVNVSLSAGGPTSPRVLVIRKNGTDINYGYSGIMTSRDTGNVSATVTLLPTEYVEAYSPNTGFGNAQLSITATATPDTIVTPVESFSTDSANLVFKTSAVTSTDPVGTFSTWSYAASTNTRTACATAPTQTIESMNANGLQIFSRAYTAASTCGSPAAIAIQIGKGFKGVEKRLYKSLSKLISGNLNYFSADGSGVSQGFYHQTYDESTGVIYFDAALNATASAPNSGFSFSDITSQGNGFLVVHASKTPTLAGISYVSPRVAYLKDVKAVNTISGSSISGWQTRVLNTEDDASEFVTLAGNQFTLPAGEYMIEAVAPTYKPDRTKLRLRNVTDATTAISGVSSYYPSAANAGGDVRLDGKITITTAKTFELQHYIFTAFASQGLGVETNAAESEVYAQLKITKVK